MSISSVLQSRPCGEREREDVRSSEHLRELLNVGRESSDCVNDENKGAVFNFVSVDRSSSYSRRRGRGGGVRVTCKTKAARANPTIDAHQGRFDFAA